MIDKLYKNDRKYIGTHNDKNNFVYNSNSIF